MIIARFKLWSKSVHAGTSGGNISMQPVYSTDPNHPNKKFWDASPSGKLEMYIQNQVAFDAFELGAEYDMVFTKVS